MTVSSNAQCVICGAYSHPVAGSLGFLYVVSYISSCAWRSCTLSAHRCRRALSCVSIISIIPPVSHRPRRRSLHGENRRLIAVLRFQVEQIKIPVAATVGDLRVHHAGAIIHVDSDFTASCEWVGCFTADCMSMLLRYIYTPSIH